MKNFYAFFLFLSMMAMPFAASAQGTDNQEGEETTETTTTNFVGTMTVDLTASGADKVVLEDQKMSIEFTSDEACTVTLYDFVFGEMNLGNIVVPDVAIATEENVMTLTGAVDGLSLMGGVFKVDVTCEGTYDLETETLVMDFVVKVMGMDIPVNFEGVNVEAGAESAISDQENQPAHYYHINGVEANANNLTPGVYVRTQGNKSSKVLVR